MNKIKLVLASVAIVLGSVVVSTTLSVQISIKPASAQQEGYIETCPGGTPAQGSCATPEGDKDPIPPTEVAPQPAIVTPPPSSGTAQCGAK